MIPQKPRSRPEHKSFTETQFEFTAHIRDPAHNPLPDGVEESRMAIYRNLIFKNVEDFMASSFPVLRKILDESRWTELIRSYIADHRAETPLFSEMPAEFLKYLEKVRQPQARDLPFMLELAHYEWMELVAARSNAPIDWTHIDKHGDLLSGHPVVSPLAWILSYEYPVHRISPEFQPKKPGEQRTNIIVYRDFKDEVGFIEINMVTTQLLNSLKLNEELTSEEALQGLATTMRHPDSVTVVKGGLDILNDLKAHDIILGVRINS